MARLRWRSARLVVAAALVLPFLAACVIGTLTPQLHTPAALPTANDKSGQLKVHLLSGELAVLDTWKASADGATLDGSGQLFDAFRQPGAKGPHSIPIASIALVETNSSRTTFSGGMTGLGTLTTIWGSLAVICTADPKGCFGSCPTFYVDGVGQDRPDAEGFSSSIARVLEARDVDALFGARVSGSRLAVTMRNEALETHAVRRVRILAAERPRGGRVLAGVDGRYYPAAELRAPAQCRAPEGDCLDSVSAFDDRERYSSADPADLAARETIEMGFAASAGRHGMVLGARQTILTTFVFYQTMAYLGRSAGDYLAALERGGPELASRAMGMARVLGGIEVFVSEADGPWRPVGRFDEAGPIAGDVQVVPFEVMGGGPLRVRLRMAKGLWRLGWVALARLEGEVQPRVIEPASVERDGQNDAATLRMLRSGKRHLITQPGDQYRIVFDLPQPSANLELFLESQGYYYEWMRGEWLAEEDSQMAALALMMPATALKRLAPEFKRREAGLERAFWSSRFRK